MACVRHAQLSLRKHARNCRSTIREKMDVELSIKPSRSFESNSATGLHRHDMDTNLTQLSREEILSLARSAKLMVEDGRICCINDMATDKEVISFVRLIESALNSLRSSG
jgi:hypothetical protein